MNPADDSDVAVISMRGVSAAALSDPSLLIAEGVDWTVRRGECWVVAGMQGSGKTDFLLMIAGLMPPAAGVYEFLGQKTPIFETERLEERMRLGMVFESGQLLNHLTVGQNIALPLRYHHDLGAEEAAERVAPLVEMLGLDPWIHSTTGTLGRSWQRRAGLARALALRPEVLVLDNPLGGLDPLQVNWWMGLLESLSRGHPWLEGRPMTLVLTASDVRPWRGTTRQFAVLQNHRFLPVGPWSALEAHQDPAVRDWLIAAALLPDPGPREDLE